MVKCSVCGSHKAGQNKLCWVHDKDGRRYKHGLHSPLYSEDRNEFIPNSVMEKLIQFFGFKKKRGDS